MLKMKISKNYITDFTQLAIFSAIVYMAGLLKIEIPGITGIDSNLIEVPLLISIFYVRKYWFLIILSAATAVLAPADGAYLLTFVPHFVALIMLRYVYLRFVKPIKSMFWHLAVWTFAVGFYYMVLLIPVFVITSMLLSYNSTADLFGKYKTLLSFTLFEQLATIIVTSLFLAQFKLRVALNKHLSEVEKIVKQRTAELTKTIEELKQTQEQLVQSEKMASLGTLTAGVAHEINNPLNYLKGAQVGLDDYFNAHGSADKPLTDFFLHSILVGVERITNIVKGLNLFSRNNEKKDEDCDIHAIIDNCLVMLNNKLKQKAVIEKDYFDHALVIKGNVGKLHQVFLNVLVNAMQAIVDNGSIKIKTYISENCSIIEISDTGIGIEEKQLSKITDPFFTTKPPGEGTGLGLSIAYSILMEHKGTIAFESEIMKGTKVIITIPIN